MTEEAILQGCIQNNASSQRELYTKYSPKMLAVCYRFAHNREDAEDMLQEGFIKVFSQIHTFRSQGAFEGWIRKIMVNCLKEKMEASTTSNSRVVVMPGMVMCQNNCSGLAPSTLAAS